MAQESSEANKLIVPLIKARFVLEKVLSVAVAVLLVAMSAVVFSNVIMRYFLSMGISWYEELSRFIFIWIVFLGAIVAFFKGDHLALDVALIYLPLKPRKMLIVFADVLVIIALIVMTQGAWAMMKDSLESGWVASTIPIPYGYVYAVGPISAVLMLLQVLIKTIEDTQVLARTLKGGK